MPSQPSPSPQEFVAKWRAATLSEHSAYQQHFLDLCRLIGHPTPAGLDGSGASFTFEAGATKQQGDPRVTAIADAARELVEKRDRWLNPEELLARLLALNLERAVAQGGALLAGDAQSDQRTGRGRLSTVAQALSVARRRSDAHVGSWKNCPCPTGAIRSSSSPHSASPRRASASRAMS